MVQLVSIPRRATPRVRDHVARAFESAELPPDVGVSSTPEPVGPGSEEHRGCAGRELTPACDGPASPETS